MIHSDKITEYVDRINPQYVAGLFDGEGCVSALLVGEHVRLKVRIAQKDPTILGLILIKYGGKLGCRNNKVRGTFCHDIYWEGKECFNILNLLKDYVIVKHDVVLLGLELSQLFINYGYHERASQDTLEKRKLIQARISSINSTKFVKGDSVEETLQ